MQIRSGNLSAQIKTIDIQMMVMMMMMIPDEKHRNEQNV
jgi:hypothetical protein